MVLSTAPSSALALVLVTLIKLFWKKRYMVQINLLIERLKSSNKIVRLEAHTRPRRASNLTPEQINALGLAKIDSDPSVAHAAQITLIIQRIKLNKIFPILGWIALVGIGLITSGSSSRRQVVHNDMTDARRYLEILSAGKWHVSTRLRQIRCRIIISPGINVLHALIGLNWSDSLIQHGGNRGLNWLSPIERK